MNYRIYCVGLLVIVQAVLCLGMESEGWIEVKKSKHNPKKHRSYNKTNPLTAACAHNDSTLVNKLIDQDDIDINAPDDKGICPLAVSACCNRLGIVVELLDHGALVDQKNFKGETPLMGAAYCGWPSMIELLLTKRAYLEERDYQGSTALMHAASGGHPEAVQKLIDFKAEVNAQNIERGRTPLHWAVRMCEGGIKKKAQSNKTKDVLAILEILLNAGANPNLKDNKRQKPLDWAEKYNLSAVAHVLREAMHIKR
jgi:uncharacterized protein